MLRQTDRFFNLAILALALFFLAPFSKASAGLHVIPDVSERPAVKPQIRKPLSVPMPVPKIYSFTNAPLSAPNCAKQKSNNGQVRALLIGINDYPSPSIPSLIGAVNDVQLLAQALKAQGVKEENLRILMDREATRDNIHQSLNQLIVEATCGDFVIIHFSGTAVRSQDYQWDGMLELDLGTILLAHDSERQDLEGNKKLLKGIFAQDVAAGMVHLRNKAATVFLSIDTCYAAGLALADRQGLDNNTRLWRWAPGTKPNQQPRSLPRLFVGAGEFAAFYAVPENSGAYEWHFGNQTVGIFSFSLAHAIQGVEEVSIRDFANHLVDIQQKNSDENSPDVMQMPVFEASNPDATFLAVNRTRNVPRDTTVVFETEMLTRGGIHTASPNYQLKGKIEDHTNLLVLFVGSKSVEPEEGGSFAIDVPLESGENQIEVIAYYKDYSSTRGVARVVYENEFLPESSTGRRLAFLIGNQSYVDKSFKALRTPIGDVNAIAKVLRSRFGFQTEIELSDGRTQNLVLHDATRGELLSTLTLIRENTSQTDELIIFYAGHGELIEELNEAYWLPVDALPGKSWSWISAGDITDEIKLMEAQHILVISDSCYSGALAREIGHDQATLRTKTIWEKMKFRSRKLLTSGAEQPVWDGGGSGHSVFAQALLVGLESMNQQYFTISELFNLYIEEAVAGNSEQLPQYEGLQKSGHKGGELVLMRANAAIAP